jgi:hypothetical protein
MNKIITTVPIVLLVLNILYFISSTSIIMLTTPINNDECYNMWASSVVSDVFALISVIACGVCIVGLYIKKPNGTDKYDAGLLMFCAFLLAPCCFWSSYIHLNISSECKTIYGTFWLFFEISIMYQIIMIVVAIIMIIDKCLICCAITDSRTVVYNKHVCCMFREPVVGLLDDEFNAINNV